MGKVKMTKEDRERFATEIKRATPVELLTVIDFVKMNEKRIDTADLKFMHSHTGRRGERLLRNVVNNFSFEDKLDTTGGQELWH